MVFDMLKLLILGVFCCYGRGDVVSIRYPFNNPCVLVDIDAEFKLVWTDFNGMKHTVPYFTLNSTTVMTGNCAKDTPNPQVDLVWSDGGTFVFSFTNKSDTISYDWNMRYSPNSVYTNNTQTGMPVSGFTLNDTTVCSGVCSNRKKTVPQVDLSRTDAIVSHSGNFGSGPSTKAFASQHEPVVNNIQNHTGMNKYQLTITTNAIKAQAFNLNNGKFSEEDRCPADLKSTRSTPRRSSATTKPTSKRTNATTKRTNATTKRTNATTKPTTGTTKPSTFPTPSTIPAPAPNAHAKQTFEVYAESKQCVLMQGEFLFTLVYPKNYRTNGSVDVGVQEIKSITGDCYASRGSENVITVNFYDDWKMDLTISKKTSSVLLAAEADSEAKYYWSHINLKYNYKTVLGGKALFPYVLANATAPEISVNLADGTYEASTGGSYLCNSNENIDLMGGNKLQTWNLQYDAFRTTNHTTFSDKNLNDCSAESKTNIVVPIAVCAAIAGLVVIVLITYLIFRRRNRKGYESVLIKTTDFGMITEYCYKST